MKSTIRSSIGRILTTALITTLCGTLVMAQEFRGVISGQVTDSHGGVIPNATVTAVREGIPQPYTAQTSSGGNYSIPYVVPGVYIVTVEVPGFKKVVRTGITVDVSPKTKSGL